MKRKPASIEQHVIAAKHLLVAKEAINAAMRTLGVLDRAETSDTGKVPLQDADALNRVEQSLSRVRLVVLGNRIHRDGLDLDGFNDGAAVYQDPYRDREINQKKAGASQ